MARSHPTPAQLRPTAQVFVHPSFVSRIAAGDLVHAFDKLGCKLSSVRAKSGAGLLMLKSK
jgi:hypothetical protein